MPERHRMECRQYLVETTIFDLAKNRDRKAKLYGISTSSLKPFKTWAIRGELWSLSIKKDANAT